MAIAQSKLTAQGQISVPAEVRKKLGIGPGSVLEWDEHEGGVVVRRVGLSITRFALKRVAFTAPPGNGTSSAAPAGSITS